MGSSAVAPPRSTAKRSSEIAPSSTGRLRIYEKPANSVAMLTGVVSRCAARRSLSAVTRQAATANSVALMA